MLLLNCGLLGPLGGVFPYKKVDLNLVFVYIYSSDLITLCLAFKELAHTYSVLIAQKYYDLSF